MKQISILALAFLLGFAGLYGGEVPLDCGQVQALGANLEVRARRFEGRELLVIRHVGDAKEAVICVVTIVGDDVLFDAVPEASCWASCRVAHAEGKVSVSIRVAEKGSQTGWMIVRKGECRYGIQKEEPGE